ncbi:hypothetical protein TRFO_16186 [Tritrichomonas foetus]|uniref:Uncharacterized protein n=1 Tax=Tritrichomonas foetus TaxID=1144522 RepID=A0A1J4KRA9_9EUKA|nr:hypothetical protein [Tritrichomonas foetus]OHT13634.1 hypothetical protein TRFO_16186 [Tritrichomonas foetus]|eukprot:OHT13634.1 hypothetical protein TRFO_16186 [Tritrichomonas foetus]
MIIKKIPLLNRPIQTLEFTSFILIATRTKMSCPFCSSRYSSPSPSSCGGCSSKLSYDPPLLDATTEVILDLRRQCLNADEARARKNKGIYHWSNVPSGASISEELARKYKCFGGSNSQGGQGVCPLCRRPLDGSSSRGASSSSAQQYPVYVPPPPQNYEAPKYPVYVPPPPQKYEPPQYPVYHPPPPPPPPNSVSRPPPRPVSVQQPQQQRAAGPCFAAPARAGGNCSGSKISEALRHIDAAQRILKHC